jgi:osmotically-inducible protein OsmY
MPEFNKTPQDYSVTSKVRIALKITPSTEKFVPTLKVGTDHGVVYLMGTVPTQKDAETVEKVARALPDVYRLVNQIEVAAS